jgi:hypothetical protein
LKNEKRDSGSIFLFLPIWAMPYMGNLLKKLQAISLFRVQGVGVEPTTTEL